MKIEFENGSSIESIDTATSNTRSKRSEEYIKYFRRYPEAFVELQGVKLLWYQKLILRMMMKDKWKNRR
jgi:hypothetical protein